MYEALLEFPEGWGGLRKKFLLWRRDGYFLELPIVPLINTLFYDILAGL